MTENADEEKKVGAETRILERFSCHQRSKPESSSRRKPSVWKQLAASVAWFNDHFESLDMTRDDTTSPRFRGFIAVSPAYMPRSAMQPS